MRLAEAAAGPINQDVRNQLLRDIAYGRDLISKSTGRVMTVPQGRPTPFNADQGAYDASVKAIQDTNQVVTNLEVRLNTAGPYWQDMTAQERDAFALWLEASKQLDSVTSKHYPSPFEMDVKKAILLAIGVGAFLGPLLFSKSEDTGFPFKVLPDAPELPFDRAPHALPMRTELPTIPYRGTPAIPVRSLPAIESIPVAERRERAAPSLPYSIPRGRSKDGPRFTKTFPGPGSGTPASAQRVPGLPAPSSPSQRPDGGRRYIYPKPE